MGMLDIFKRKSIWKKFSSLINALEGFSNAIGIYIVSLPTAVIPPETFPENTSEFMVSSD